MHAAGPPSPSPSGPFRPGAVLPSAILLWDAAEVADPPAAPCCLRTTAAGDRVVVYRTGPGGGVEALADVLADARPRADGGWWAPLRVHRLTVPVLRQELLADEVLAPVFRHLRGRRRLPVDPARRLRDLIGGGDACAPGTPGTRRSGTG
ncbi:hypothetical protein SAMN05216207_102460 [Pseudonocardia ammonioxydans]|uniref:Uncharacterized protein n=1 Tax=Pseudonocardia ammonioxydans TaxID=260086 RepID=A0A1I5CWX2_PSUAM|nr:hypothetical protein [Pseudonocardia ammonioxydans]SFN91505.1 hypothetical protein SAMN05216207_102460 [Pseudonocardia ammonioxydans]